MAIYKLIVNSIHLNVNSVMHAAQAAQDLLIGSPDTIAAHIEALVDEVGTDYVIAAFAWGDLAHHETLASLELFVNEVMPRF